ncbi:NUDIX hydrolase [Arhodomonas sp. SL1]|uniref:NUDIX hydrolase n=1 Tax=Arhodomonas sp. SL1 TaxID=3425691 RepID=UPI003F881C5A
MSEIGDNSGSRVPWAVAVDVVIFTVDGEQLFARLLRRGKPPFVGQWALPGALLGDEESPSEGARRVLRERLGMPGVYLEQLYSFGAPDRDPRGRVVSVAYFALIPPSAEVGTGEGTQQWHDVRALPPLAFDHDRILALAHRRLAAKLRYSTIAFQLMPERFTLSQLQSVYETIGGEALDKRNFRKRIRALDCIEPTDELDRSGNHRPARLYRLKVPGEVNMIR